MSNLFIQQDPSLERKRRLAEAMLLKGQSNEPIRHWTQGAAKIANSLGGAYISKKTGDEEQARRDEYAKTLAAALSGSPQTQPVQGPSQGGTAPQQQVMPREHPPIKPTLMDSRSQDLISVLAGNPDTAPLALQLKIAEIGRKPESSPSSLREWNAFQQMSPEEQKQYLLMKRASQVKDFGGFYGVVNPLDHSVDNAGNKTLAPNQTPEHAASVRGAEESTPTGQAKQEKLAGEIDEQRAKKLDRQQERESALETADSAIDIIDKALSHPGREAATGMSSLFNKVALPGSDRKDFLVLADQLKGKNFLEAYKTLKGGGQITEIEGLKAENAQARLNTAQSEEEFVEALKEMQSLIVQRKKRIATYGDEGGKTSGWSIKVVGE